ncbi:MULTISPECIES: hypothetical protein [Burkholderia]|uniref:hypothetical protein n=1 Tax=Burkholderia TaxID=32008 RepID=UPI000558516E|nr:MULTISPECIES: hypothetical protein [Burkholderia]TCT31928.1 hypothetical protein EC918_102155 [Burkholderia vietnamiensis]SCZ28238.1 hypothetical protein SAMN02787148_106281 [Burkholderia vietnamiensis]SFX63719.1 hypothetical protein SAMN02787160_106282 [Burkholderia vietnamiensis]
MNNEIAGVLVANPDAFETVPELRRELGHANERLRRYAADAQRRDIAGNELAGLVNRVLMQHLRGDHRGVAAILDAQLDASPRLREMLEETNESNEIRQTGQWAEAARAGKQAEPLPPYNCEGDDPWSKKTVAELRQALDTANRAGVNAVSELKALNRVLADVTAEVSKIVVAHLKGDRDAVSQALTTFCKNRVVVMGDEKRKVH